MYNLKNKDKLFKSEYSKFECVQKRKLFSNCNNFRNFLAVLIIEVGGNKLLPPPP